MSAPITNTEINKIKYIIDLEVKGRQIGEESREDFYRQSCIQHLNKTEDAYSKGMKKMVMKINRHHNKEAKHLHFIKIIKIGNIACCHFNSRVATYLLNHLRGKKDFELVKGYNITSCPCNKLVQSEVHSVVRHIDSGTLYDFTEDFHKNMDYKFFIESEYLTKYYDNFVLRQKDRRLDFIRSVDTHTCDDGAIWDVSNSFHQMNTNKHETLMEELIESGEGVETNYAEFLDGVWKMCCDHFNTGMMIYHEGNMMEMKFDEEKYNIKYIKY